jgi:chromosome segregation ATPase
MKALLLIGGLILASLATGDVAAQNTGSAAETAEQLRAQLKEVQYKEAELQARAKQLEEDLKPENIQRSLAGIGSTRPEELRELRRKQLTIEKEGVNTQLELLAAQRGRLEAAITSAESAAYRQSAEGSSLLDQFGPMQYVTNPKWLGAMFAGLLGVVALVALVVVVRRLS